MMKSIVNIAMLILLWQIELSSQLDKSNVATSQAAKLEQVALEAQIKCSKVTLSQDASSIEVCTDAIEKSYKAGTDSLRVLNLSSLALYVFFSENSEAAYKYAHEAKQIAEKLGTANLKMEAYYTYAMTWERFHDLDSAVKYLNEASAIAIELGDNEMQTRVISGLGYLFSIEELYEEAEVYFTDALAVAERKGSKNSIAFMQIFLGGTYSDLGELVKAEAYFENALEYYSKAEENRGPKTYLLYGLAKLESKKGNYKKSIDLLTKEHDLFRFKPPKRKYTLLLIADNYFDLKDYKVALKHYHELESSLLKIDDLKIQKGFLKKIGECYLNLGNDKLAIKYYQKHAIVVDMLSKDKLEKSVANAELKYKLKKEETENKYLTSEKEKLILEAKSKNLSIAIFLISFLFMSIGAFFVYKRQQEKTAFLKEVTVEKEKINKVLLKQGETKDVANEALLTKNKELSNFAGVVAHDIKAPIRTTSSFIQLIKNRMDVTKADEKIKDYFAFIEKSNKNLNSLIDDLLQFTTSENNLVVNDDVDLNEIVAIVKDNLAHQIDEKSATINVDSLPVITANRSDMIRLFQNIIANAIKFTKDRDPVIDIKTDSHINHYTISIKDNGIGMKPEYLDRIFNPLIRLHSASEYEGSGLGLATCKNIVGKLNGNLQVQSSLDVGSTFVIELPKSILVDSGEINKALSC